MKKFSILTNDLSRCYICGRPADDIHEVFPGTANRRKSIKWGCCIPVCREHHTLGKTNVQYDKKVREMIQKQCQKRFTELYDTDFMSVFHKNYL